MLFATLAQFGRRTSSARMAYEAGMSSVLPMRRPPYQPLHDWPQRLSEALPRLEELHPFAKKAVIEGLVKTIASDEVMTVEEAELLRAVCALLHCPLPPAWCRSEPGRRGRRAERKAGASSTRRSPQAQRLEERAGSRVRSARCRSGTSRAPRCSAAARSAWRCRPASNDFASERCSSMANSMSDSTPMTSACSSCERAQHGLVLPCLLRSKRSMARDRYR